MTFFRNSLIVLFIIAKTILNAQSTSELLHLLNKGSLTDSAETDIYLRLSGTYLQSDLDSNMLFAQKALENIDTLKKDKYYASVYSCIARAYFKRGEYNKALEYYKKCLKVWVDLKVYPAVVADIHLNIANTLTMRGDYAEAVSYGLKAEKYFESVHRSDQIGDVNNLLGAIYYYKNDFDNAILFYTKAIDRFKETDKIASMNNPLNNLGIIYMEKNDFKQANDCYLKALEICLKTNNKLGVIQVYSNLGSVSQRMEEYDKALKYFFEVLKLCKENDDKDAVLIATFNIGEAYRGKKDDQNALKYFYEARHIAKSIGKQQVYVESFRNIGGVYFYSKKYKEASAEFFRYITLKDTLLNEENSQQINELQTKYETEKKEKDLALANKENEKVTIENKRQSLVLLAGTIVGILIFVLLVFSVRAYRTKRKDNELLNTQKLEIERQKAIVDVKQKEMVDSIHYAQQIQKTLLANHELVNQTIPDSFVLFKPKDIVSGDFYWATHKDDRFYLAVCDSTGHGVPGAFMSLLNISFLNEAISEKNIFQPNEVFEHVRKRLIENISQEGRQDGMDGIIICIQKNKITYASAQNAPILVSQNNLLELEADKMPVGKGERKETFRNYSIDYKKGDVLYLYTDGYADQFGGPKGKKFKYKTLNQLLLQNCNKPVQEQKEILNTTFEQWRGNLDQIDDVCIIGIRL